MNPCRRRIERGHWAEDLARGSCLGMIGPRNTLSNAAFPLAGLLVWTLDPDASGAAFAFAMTLLGVGSGWYHWTKTLGANRADWAGIYGVLGCLVAHGADPNAGGAMLASTLLAGGLLAYAVKGVGANEVIGLGLVLALLPAAFSGGWPWVLAALGTFGLAKAVWIADKRQRGWVGVWGHAAWHVLAAPAFSFTYWAQRVGSS